MATVNLYESIIFLLSFEREREDFIHINIHFSIKREMKRLEESIAVQIFCSDQVIDLTFIHMSKSIVTFISTISKKDRFGGIWQAVDQ